ncbi:hypothetical protein [Streptomyces sp.]|uniref:hypothetical protein n=1 Tax=Streptomyces sp. TaxID=1931 RepID=UPI0028123A8A|nr:hypothetical protein [Streptomyces sp.]
MHSAPLRRSLAVLPLLLAVSLTACSPSGGGGGGDGEGEPAVGKVPVMLETKDVELPLNAYDATGEEQASLSRAQQELTRQCMARFGFDYVTTPPAEAPRTGNRYLFGVVDAQEAARYGYQNPTASESPQRPARAPMSKAEERVLFGEEDLDVGTMPMNQQEAERRQSSAPKVNGEALPVGGCGREAYLKLYAPQSDAVDIMFVFNLKSEAESRTKADSRVRKNDQEWSACMKDAGYQVKDPMEAPSELGFEGATLSSAAAVAAATADVACKKKVNLVGVRYAVTTAYQKRLIDKHAQTLDLARRQQEERLKLAAGLLT